MSGNCDAIDIFWIFGQFGAVRRPDSGHRVCKSYVNFTPTPPQNEPLSPPRLGLIYLIIVRFQHGKHTLNETFF